ncbi:hypothetical protein PHJA_001598600 [Phtheirospermum japonicum]|uniref:Uncharacterized protein n=1 Tax=Phtheirospermum japonicum TaxID=374723 RepID=A0A830C8M6_9LAMI|nr:hypothetical protein PHJA_001598600 [Phtheirospermum japonicum]
MKLLPVREGARVMWGYVNRILSQLSLIRESSMANFPWSGVGSRAASKLRSYSTVVGAAGTAASAQKTDDYDLMKPLDKPEIVSREATQRVIDRRLGGISEVVGALSGAACWDNCCV